MQDTQNSKAFTWSFSRLKAYEDCPRRFNETMRLKRWPEPRSKQLDEGDETHAAMAKALKTGTRLPLAHAAKQHWIDKVNRTKGELLVEDQSRWAITRDFRPTAWFSKQVWARTVADAVKVDDNAALIVDWKTGKSANADIVQLELCSLIGLCQFPDVKIIRADFVWLNEDDKTTIVIRRDEAADRWAEITPRVEALKQAELDEFFPPKPGNFCRSWCSVKSCEYNGK